VSKLENAVTTVSQNTETTQMRTWQGEFGRAYTDRNILDVAQLNALWSANYGVTREALNLIFLENIPKTASFLEVGCNVGNQLLQLQQLGYGDLAGVELQPYALQLAQSRVKGPCLKQGSALALPYKDHSFDVVFTSGVLIHIAPEHLPQAMDEIHRCSKTYIWGTEYYAPELTEVTYRGHERLLWKMDYARKYLQRFSDLDLIREQRLPYLVNDNVDSAFLLKKRH
jgi:pseudaminic acid biosynthesis-associated methylase